MPLEDRLRIYEYFNPLLVPRGPDADVSMYQFLTLSFPVGSTQRSSWGAFSGTVPWGAWAPTIGVLILIQGSMWFLALFFSLLYRHVIVEVENVEFANTAVLAEYLVENTSEGPTIPFFTNRYFLGGFLFEMVVGGMFISTILPSILTWFSGYGNPLPFGGEHAGGFWPFGINWTGEMELTGAILPASMLAIAHIPGTVGWTFHLPMDVLYSFGLFWILWNFIIPTAFVGAGLAPAWPNIDFWGSGWWINGYYNHPTEYAFGVPEFPEIFSIGLLIGLTLYPLWRHRKTMIPILTSLFKSPPEDIEKDSPLPYRYIMIGVIVSALVWIGTCMALGTGPMTIGIIVVTMLMFPGMMWAMAETGGSFGNAHAPMIYAWSTFPGIITAIFISAFNVLSAPTEAVALLMMFTWGATLVTFISSWAVMMAWKVQRDHKVAKGDMLKAMTITIVFVAIVHTISGFVWGSLFPIRPEAPAISGGWGSFFIGREINFIERGAIYPYLLSNTQLTNIAVTIIGSIIMIFLAYEARRRVGVLRWLNPLAMIMALLGGYYIWLPMFLTLIIKFLLMRVGGAPAVEKGKHFAIGLFAAFAFAVFFEQYVGGRLLWQIFGFGQGWPAWPAGR
jgi:hypothetical protein